MAHKLLTDGVNEQKRTKKRFKISIPSMMGKFGLSLFVGQREVFIGLMVGQVEIERIIRKRLIKAPKASVKVFRWD